jgi:hypothetical protein
MDGATPPPWSTHRAPRRSAFRAIGDRRASAWRCSAQLCSDLLFCPTLNSNTWFGSTTSHPALRQTPCDQVDGFLAPPRWPGLEIVLTQIRVPGEQARREPWSIYGGSIFPRRILGAVFMIRVLGSRDNPLLGREYSPQARGGSAPCSRRRLREHPSSVSDDPVARARRVSGIAQ